MENTMNITKTNNNKNTVELKKELNAQGCEMNVICVNGEPFAYIGYVSEADKEACLKAVQTAIDSSASKIEAMHKLQNICEIGHAGIDPDEEITVEGLTFMISYKDKKAYRGTEEIANLDNLNLPAVGKEVIKTLLEDRIKLWISENIGVNNEYYENDYDEGYDDGYEDGHEDGYDEGYDDGYENGYYEN